VAVADAKIVSVGEDSEIEKLRGPGTKVIDAGGRLVLPGICRLPHSLSGWLLSLGRVNLEGAKDATDIQQRLRDYAAKHPGQDWVLGRGWNYAMFGAEALLTKNISMKFSRTARLSLKAMTATRIGQFQSTLCRESPMRRLIHRTV